MPDYLKFFNESKIIKSVYDPINKDPCYQVNLADYYQNLLKNKKDELLINKVILCDDGCTFEGLGIQEMEIKCFCQERIDMDKLSFKEQISNYFKNFGNMDVLKCYKLFFNKNGQKENYLSEIIIFLLIINIICIAYTLFSVFIKEYYRLILFFSNYMRTKIYDFKTIKDLNSKNLNIETLTNEQNEIIDNLCTYLNNRKSKENKNEEKENIMQKDKIIKMLNEGKLNNYYNCLINLFPTDNYEKYLIEDEINNLDFYEYQKLEKRNYLQIVWSIFKTNYDFYSTFLIFPNKDYKIYTVKIITYINTILLSLDLNVSFYTDDTMHKIYVDSGNNNIVNRLPIVLLTNSISLIPSILFELFFSSYQDYFIELKSNMDNDITKARLMEEYYKKLLIRIFCC